MKIISWNLKNVGQTKLGKAFTPTMANFGLGNTVLDYIMNVVMGSTIWNNIASTHPADIFVVIELKSGGNNKSKGHPAFGTAHPTMQLIVGAMNNIVANTPVLQPNYFYRYVSPPVNVAGNNQYTNPMITGRHETVGVVYNSLRLTPTNSAVFRDHNNQFLNPRTPFGVQFNIVNTTDSLTIIGIHAPPTSGGAAVRYKKPIDFMRRAATIPAFANTAIKQFIMGDYNCDPASTYTGANGVVGWNIPGYGTLIANGTLSSVRRRVNNGNVPPANYLSEAYDNLMYNFNAGGGAVERVLDTIANARYFGAPPHPPPPNPPPPAPLYPGNLVALLNNYNKVSDHLPIMLEF